MSQVAVKFEINKTSFYRFTNKTHYSFKGLYAKNISFPWDVVDGNRNWWLTWKTLLYKWYKRCGVDEAEALRLFSKKLQLNSGFATREINCFEGPLAELCV